MIYFFIIGLILICFLSIGAMSLRSFSRHTLEGFYLRSGLDRGGNNNANVNNNGNDNNGELDKTNNRIDKSSIKKERVARKISLILKYHDLASVSAGILRLICVVVFLVGLTLFLIWGGKLPVSGFSNDNFFASYRNWLFFVIVSIIFLAGVEFWIPKAISKLWGTHIIYYTWSLWYFLSFILYPFILCDRFFDIFLRRLAGEAEEDDDEGSAFEDEIRMMVTEGHREGLLEEDEREMIEGVMGLSGVIVSEIMTPRTDMKSIPDNLTWGEMLDAVITIPHSRIPVYRENRDEIIGVIHSKDILKEIAVSDVTNRRAWTELMKEPLFVPETKPVATLLQEFQNTKPAPDDDAAQRTKGHLAIVLDEYGGVSGIVTLEDILEEIVGEILDEHDPMVVAVDICEVGQDTFEVLGKVRVEELNETLHLNLPEDEDYDTVAGYIFSTLGHVPEVGESVDFEHESQKTTFTVIEATRRRIEKVKVKRF
ncbi:MAG: hemolysin family protein [Planctomycetaceae bacterium]|jgi:CBS domain containing-hemolysin-like protein|nr:hemolysin family protein [Planctomycetaceae bacterium]